MNTTKFKKCFLIGALMMATGIALGAFGAHGLKNIVSEYYLTVFEKGVFYQLIHGLAILILSLLYRVTGKEYIKTATYIFFVSIIIFSGSLYLLVITNIKILGAITPIGGSGLIFTWCYLAYKALRDKE